MININITIKFYKLVSILTILLFIFGCNEKEITFNLSEKNTEKEINLSIISDEIAQHFLSESPIKIFSNQNNTIQNNINANINISPEEYNLPLIVTDTNENLILLGINSEFFYYNSGVFHSSIEISARSTALGLILLNPLISSLTIKPSDEIIQNLISSNEFKTLKTEISSKILTSKHSILSDNNIYELANNCVKIHLINNDSIKTQEILSLNYHEFSSDFNNVPIININSPLAFKYKADKNVYSFPSEITDEILIRGGIPSISKDGSDLSLNNQSYIIPVKKEMNLSLITPVHQYNILAFSLFISLQNKLPINNLYYSALGINHNNHNDSSQKVNYVSSMLKSINTEPYISTLKNDPDYQGAINLCDILIENNNLIYQTLINSITEEVYFSPQYIKNYTYISKYWFNNLKTDELAVHKWIKHAKNTINPINNYIFPSAPISPPPPQILNIYGNKIELNLFATEYTDFIKIIINSTNVLTTEVYNNYFIYDLLPSTDYEINLSCINNYGESNLSDTILLKTNDYVKPIMTPITNSIYYIGSSDINFPEDEKPFYPCSIDSFLIGIYPVTLINYDLFCIQTNRNIPIFFWENRSNIPVFNASWYDAIEFCNWLSKKEKLTPCYQILSNETDPNNLSVTDPLKWKVTCDFSANGYRLPTESEWEITASGGLSTQMFSYPGSDDPDESCWHFHNSGLQLKPTGQLISNEAGCFDMGGNVWEWCYDWYANNTYLNYSNNPIVENPKGSDSGSKKSVRGGSVLTSYYECRVKNRNSFCPGSSNNDFTGFRIVKKANHINPEKLILIPQGTITINEKNLTIESFYISAKELTFNEYDLYCENVNISKPDSENFFRGNHPVINVSWIDACKYCNWISEKNNLNPVYNFQTVSYVYPDITITAEMAVPDINAPGYRLLYEKEWIYAFNGGKSNSQFTYSGSNLPDSVAWYDLNSSNQTHATGTKTPNSIYLYDLSGNVMEWVYDGYVSELFPDIEGNTFPEPNTDIYKVLKGGAWNTPESFLKSDQRFIREHTFKSNFTGFRIAKNAE